MRIHKKSLIVILFIILITALVLGTIYICYINLFIPAAADYNRATYSVVIHNNTELADINITISYGPDPNDKNLVEYAQVADLKGAEYRKINIPTDKLTTSPPYNVWVEINSSYGNEQLCVGYFGVKTGGFAVVEIGRIKNELDIKQLSESDGLYKKVYRRHRKNQEELSWF